MYYSLWKNYLTPQRHRTRVPTTETNYLPMGHEGWGKTIRFLDRTANRQNQHSHITDQQFRR